MSKLAGFFKGVLNRMKTSPVLADKDARVIEELRRVSLDRMVPPQHRFAAALAVLVLDTTITPRSAKSPSSEDGAAKQPDTEKSSS